MGDERQTEKKREREREREREAVAHAARVGIPFAGCLMWQSRGVIKCQTNAERESRSGSVHDEWLGRAAGTMLAQAITLYKHTAARKRVGRSVGRSGFAGGEKCHLNETETETKGKERQPRGCGLRLKRIHPSGGYFCDVPCPLFFPVRARAPLNLCPGFLSFFHSPRTPQTFPLRTPPQRTTRMDLVFRVPCASSRLSTTSLPPPHPFHPSAVVRHVRAEAKITFSIEEEDRGDHREVANARESLSPISSLRSR